MEARFDISPSSVAEEGAAARLRVFAVLLAVGVLFHNATTTAWEFVSWDSVLALSAFWVLARPSSLKRLLVLAVVQLAEIALDAPFISDHEFLCGVWAMAALTCFVVETRGRPFRAARFHASLAPIMCSSMVLVYLLTAIAKLNHDYLDPDLSAAFLHLPNLQRWLPLPEGDWIRMPVIYLVLVVGLALPVLLVWRRTRFFGVIVAFLFHGVMAMTGYVPFSALAPAFLLFFLPDSFSRWLLGLDRRSEAAFGPWLTASRHVLLTGAFLAWAAVTSALTWGPSSWGPLTLGPTTLGPLTLGPLTIGPLTSSHLASVLHPASMLGTTLFLVYSVGILVVIRMYAGDTRRLEPAAGGRVFRMRRLVYLVFPLVILANGISPYVGLKTMYSFTMFSNLQTGKDQWNHLFIPRSVRVFDHEDDAVRIIESSDPVLAASARNGGRLLDFHFRQYVSERPRISVTYEHGGRIERVACAGDHPGLSRRPGSFLRELFDPKVFAWESIFPPR